LLSQLVVFSTGNVGAGGGNLPTVFLSARGTQINKLREN